MFAGKMSFALYRTTPISTAAPEDVAPVAAALSEDKTLRERWQEKTKTGSATPGRVFAGWVYVQCPNHHFLSQEFNNIYTILFFVSDCICLGIIYRSNQLSTSQTKRKKNKPYCTQQ